MRTIIIIGLFIAGLIGGCHSIDVGFLITENASYMPDTLVVHKTPDPVADATRIKYNTPWQTMPLQGYEGTEPVLFSIESIRSPLGEEAARVFQSELTIIGAGKIYYPLTNNARPGRYIVSIRLTNEGYSKVVEDAFTFIVVE